jgi:hypothetical protein
VAGVDGINVQERCSSWAEQRTEEASRNRVNDSTGQSHRTVGLIVKRRQQQIKARRGLIGRSHREDWARKKSETMCGGGRLTWPRVISCSWDKRIPGKFLSEEVQSTR